MKPTPASTPQGAGRDERRIEFWLFWLIVSAVILAGGGRIVSSDETSTFLTVESIVTRGKLDIPLTSPNVTIIDGKAYTWYEPGIVVAGIPFYLVGSFIAKVLPLSATQEGLLIRAVVSCASAFVSAWLGLMFFALCRRFLMSARQALVMTLVLIFSTFLFPYFKTFMREPVLTLCLLGGAGGVMTAVRSAKPRGSLIKAGIFLGFGVLTKAAFLVSCVPILVFLALERKGVQARTSRRKLDDLFALGVPILVVGLGGIGLYNLLRFGNPLTLGYSGGTSFGTPLVTGLFGLLLSPGKGFFWFAPVLLFLPWAFRTFWQDHRNEAGCIAGVAVLNLLLYASYTAWGGDGSWGPRYLAPLVPLLLLPVALKLSTAGPVIRRTALAFAAVGVVVQFGGTAVYAGSYLREIKEYPYQRNFDDPEFLSRAHFIPDFSPIIGHWKVLLRNGGEHLRGEYPRFTAGVTVDGSRLLVQQSDEEKLLHTLDFWFTYALYTGVSAAVVLGLIAAMLCVCGLSIVLLRNALAGLHLPAP